MRMLIGGEWREAADGQATTVFNPSTEEPIDSVPQAGAAEVEEALRVAQRGKALMAALPAHRRRDSLLRISQAILEREQELATLLAQENGKPIRQTMEEVRCAAHIFGRFAEEAVRIMGSVIPADAQPGNERHFSFVVRQPLGVVAAIVPFNYPVELFAHKAAPALAAGNAVIAKPPTACPLTLLRIAELILQSGIPAEGFQMLTGAGALVGEALAASPLVDMITVTGSTRTGQRIGELAAQTLKRVSMELGGNDVSVVFADADLGLAADAIVKGRLTRGNGQICCAAKRVLVEETVRDEFTNLLVGYALEAKVGSALDPQTDVGPLISASAALAVEQAVDEAIASGAALLTGGRREGTFYLPTVLSEVTPSMRVFHEEVFGPVLPVVGFHTEAEALALANDSPYGLQAGIFTRDVARAMRFALELQAGGVIVNWSGAFRAANLPFGGVKLSGRGREGIHCTIEEMTELKSIVLYNLFPSPPSGEPPAR